MKLLLVDDHQLFLDGLALVLSKRLANVDILRADTVDKAIELGIANTDIELALIDLAMPKGGGEAFLEHVIQRELMLPTAVLSATECPSQISNVLSKGALGFIPKAYNTEKLIGAIEQILAGFCYVPEDIQLKLSAINEEIEEQKVIAENYEITSRQLEVLHLLAKGYSNSKIAQLLFISEHTVKSHLKQIFQKLASDNRVNCINKAQQLGLI